MFGSPSASILRIETRQSKLPLILLPEPKKRKLINLREGIDHTNSLKQRHDEKYPKHNFNILRYIAIESYN